MQTFSAEALLTVSRDASVLLLISLLAIPCSRIKTRRLH